MSQRGRKNRRDAHGQPVQAGKRERQNRLLIVATLIELGYTRFWSSLIQVKHIGRYIDAGMLVPWMGSMVVDTHNQAIQAALQHRNWDYLVWLEHDHEFPEDVLERFWYCREPVVSAMYNSRQPPYNWIIYFWNEDKTHIREATDVECLTMLQNPGLHEVGGVPSGCVAIRRDVLEAWDRHFGEDEPWYASPTRRRLGIVTDDIWFCRHVLDMGFKIYVDSRIEVKHIVTAAVDRRFWEAGLLNRIQAEQRAAAANGQDGEAETPHVEPAAASEATPGPQDSGSGSTPPQPGKIWTPPGARQGKIVRIDDLKEEAPSHVT